ncbi:hypothetical protein V144x_52760 [Gimesia aquarii]|uniref:Uncharacterized protein n=1 Tax=Gimesia aquarii TaxID=2527964 RepID=A0A517W3D7_9PLAN|nr:hypothetical protein V144x_52760 [Gimesia aquarii]
MISNNHYGSYGAEYTDFATFNELPRKLLDSDQNG